MIVTEYYLTRQDGVKLNKTYSDQGFYIKQADTGDRYDAAIDPEGVEREYIETDEPIVEVTDNE